MATKEQQFRIFEERFRELAWDLHSGNKTIDRIYTSLQADCRELLETPPEDDSDPKFDSQMIPCITRID